MPQATQDTLVREMIDTGMVDSMRGIPSASVDHHVSNGMSVDVYTYPDGSIAVLEAQIPVVASSPKSGGMVLSAAANAVTGCTTTSGSGWVHYDNCQVSTFDGVVTLTFKVSYEKYSGAFAKITASDETQAKASCLYGSCTEPTRSLWRPQSTSTTKAVVKYHTYYTSWNGASGGDAYAGFWLDLYGNFNLTNS